MLKKTNLIQIIKEETNVALEVLLEKQEETRKAIELRLSQPKYRLAYAFLRLYEYEKAKRAEVDQREFDRIRIDLITPAQAALQIEFNTEKTPTNLKPKAKGMYENAKATAFKDYSLQYFMSQSDPITTFMQISKRAFNLIKNTKFKEKLIDT